MESIEDTVRAEYDRFNRLWDDAEVSDEWEFHPPPDLVGRRVYRGKEGSRQLVGELDDAFASFRAEPQEVLAAEGGEVVVRARVIATGRHSGVDSDREEFHVLTMSDDETRRVRCFTKRAEAMDAAGLED
ncbi:MAG: nuclear transport factor 2 family protein [Solirubrobacterales bacterium]